MPRGGCNADSICRRAELLVMAGAGRRFMDRYVDSIPAGLFPSCVIRDQWSPCSECSSLSWIIAHFLETIMAQLGLDPAGRGSQSALAPPYHPALPLGLWGGGTGVDPSWAHSRPGPTWHSESGLWPQGRAQRWAFQCRGLSWGSQGSQPANELPLPRNGSRFKASQGAQSGQRI